MAKQAYITVDQRWLLTKDGKAVPSGHPDGVRLLATPGTKLKVEVAERVGIINPESVGGKIKRLWAGPPRDKARST